jgi:hypothetical protein
VTLDRHDVCAGELTTAVAYVSGWSYQLEITQVYAEAMRALEGDKPRVRIFTDSEHG